VEQRALRVDGGGPVAREQLERKESGATRRRTFVLEPAPQELELLAVAELADRAVGDGALAEIGAPRCALEFVVPLRPECRELALGAGRRQLVGLSGG
jgi:hypothetical protein